MKNLLTRTGRGMTLKHRKVCASWAVWMLLGCVTGCGGDSTGTPENMNDDAMPTMDLSAAPDTGMRSSDMGSTLEPDMTRLSCVDCPGTQRCNESTGMCEESEACGEDVDCLSGRVCLDGQCAEGCAATGCPGALVCPETGARCVEAETCDSDAGCEGARLCVRSECIDPCLEDAVCPGRQSCDLASGRCVEPAMCLSAEDCDGDRLCTDGACVDPCSDDAPCPDNFSCQEGTCIEGDNCMVDAHCLGDRLCLDGACIDRCREDADCPGARRCQLETGVCPEPERCDGDDACDSGRVCVDARCTDPCAPEDCPGEQRCLDNRCIEPVECTEDVDCIGRRYCDAGTCRPPCEENADCFGADTCDIDNGRCLSAYPGCRMDNDCMPGEACIRGVCRAVGCQEHSDCEDQCVDQACGPRFGIDCAADADCELGFLCALPVAACVDSGCVTDDECGGLTPRCRFGQCSACRADQDCAASEYCADGLCIEHGACADDRDCPGPNTACVQGACVPPPCGGDAFDDDLNVPTLSTRTYSDLVLCDGDEDLYRVDLWPGQGLRATLRHLPEDGQLELTVRSLDEETTARVENGVAVAGILAQDLIRRAEILVRGRSGFRTRYSLDLTRTGNHVCVPDDGEPLRGNAQQNQGQTWAGSPTVNRLCERDEDWYSMRIPGGTTLDFEVSSDNLNAVEVTLHNERGVEVARALNNGRSLELSTDIVQEADYGLKVALGVGGGSATNILSASVSPGPNAAQAACQSAPRLNVDQVYWTSPRLEVDRFSGSCQGDVSRIDRVLNLRIQQAGRYEIRTRRQDRGGALFIRSECSRADSELGCAQGVDPLILELQPGSYFLFLEMTLVDGQGVEVRRLD